MDALPYDPERIKGLAVSETGFVFDPRTGHSYTANGTGLAVIAGMRDGLALDVIADALARDHDVAAAVIEDDVKDFVALLGEHGLVPRS